MPSVSHRTYRLRRKIEQLNNSYVAKTIFIVLALFLAVGLYYLARPACQKITSYRIVVGESQSALSYSEALEAVRKATLVWELGVDKNLFTHSQEEGELTIEFVDAQNKQELSGDENQNNVSDLLKTRRTKYEAAIRLENTLSTSYTQKEKEHNTLQQNYELLLAQFNQGLGTSTPESLDKLQKEVTTSHSMLGMLRSELEKQEGLVEFLGEHLEQNISSFHFSDNDSNIKGDHRKGHITIYYFHNDADLVQLIAHELGHSLGVGHVPGASSVMHAFLYANPGDTIMLNDHDLEGFNNACSLRSGPYAWVDSLLKMLSYLGPDWRG